MISIPQQVRLRCHIDWVQCKKLDRQKRCRAIWKAREAGLHRTTRLFQDNQMQVSACRKKSTRCILRTRDCIRWELKPRSPWQVTSCTATCRKRGRAHFGTWIHTWQKISKALWQDHGWKSAESTSGKQLFREEAQISAETWKTCPEVQG